MLRATFFLHIGVWIYILFVLNFMKKLTGYYKEPSPGRLAHPLPSRSFLSSLPLIPSHPFPGPQPQPATCANKPRSQKNGITEAVPSASSVRVEFQPSTQYLEVFRGVSGAVFFERRIPLLFFLIHYLYVLLADARWGRTFLLTYDGS